MKRVKKRRPSLRFEACEPRHLLAAAPIAVNDNYTIVEDTPFQIASSSLTFIATESVWKYLDNGSNQGTAWRARTFNDSSWGQGPAELGYGDGDEATVLSFGGNENNKFPTTYFRHHFNVTSPGDVAELLVGVRFDDGVALYLNGTEIARDNLGNNAAFDEFALGNTDSETDLVPFAVNPALLIAGDNVLAAEVHQTNPTSSDISFDLYLTGSVGATGVLTNDTDADGDPLTVQLVNGPSHGALRLNLDGSFEYFPNLNFSGVDTFTYRASDGALLSNIATVNLTVTPVNDVPLAVPDRYHALAGNTLNISANTGVLANDLDVDGNNLSAVLVSNVSNGALTLNNNGSFIYVPNNGFTGNDQFTYRANDGSAQSQPATVSILVTTSNQLPVSVPDSYSVMEDSTLTVSAAIAAPPMQVFSTNFNNGVPPLFSGVAMATSVAGLGGIGNGSNTFTGNLLVNSSNPESSGDPALPTTLTLIGLPDHDSIDIGFLLALMDSWDGNTAPGPIEPDIFNVRVDGEIVFSHSFDSVDANDQSYVSPPNGLLIQGVDLGFAGEFEAAYDMSLETSLQRIPHSNSTLTIEWFGSGNGYRAVVNNAREPESWGIDNVSVVLRLGGGGLPQSTTLIPVGADWRYLDNGTNQGTAWRNSTFNDSSWSVGPAELGYGDGDEATIINFGGDPGNKFVTTYFRRDFNVADAAAVTELDVFLKRDDGAVVYINGTEAIVENIVSNPAFDTFAANGSANENDYLLFSLNPSLLVTGKNVIAVEVHQDDFNSSDVSFDLQLSVTQLVGGGSNKLGVVANDIDPEGAALTAVLSNTTSHGALTFNGNGTFTYIPTANFAGTDTFSYRAKDAFGTGNPTTVTINVIPGPNDRPTVQNKSFNASEDTQLTVSSANGLLVGAADTDMDPLTALLATPPSHGNVTVNPNGSFTYNPTPNYFGADSFTYVAFDGTTNSIPGTVSLSVAAQPDPPTANTDSYFIAPNTTLNVSALQGVLANDSDVDGDSLTAVLVSGTNNGALSLNPNGSFTYIANNGFRGTDSFRYRASDGSNQSAITTVSITVDGPPVGIGDSYSTSEDTVRNVSAAQGVLANDTDPENDSLTTTLVSQAVHGIVALNPNGSFSYTPNQDFNGVDTFTYRASDGDQTSNLTTVAITVSAVNDAPNPSADRYEVFQNTTLTTSAATGVLANDIDVDGPTMTVQLVPGSGPQHGQLSLNPNGSFTYVPNVNYVGSDSFSYRMSDGLLTSSPTTVTFDVIDDSSVIVINEIMYHPASENVLDEYIELYNTGNKAVDLTGWQFSRGVNYVFPSVSLAAGGYLVVAADVARFNITYGGAGVTVIGGWDGQLSNRTEEIELDDETGKRVDRVTYADEGDWALRRIQPDSRAGRDSWEWVAGHDGGGSSLELVNPLVTNRRGQNWASSTNGGTPGSRNSAFSTLTVPFIDDVKHSPAIPKSNQAVTITAQLSDAEDTPLSATLFYRVSTASPGAFISLTMADTGVNGDKFAGDGEFSVVLPPRPNGTVIEFYVRAQDANGNSRTWPAPTNDQGAQGANALYQVDNETYDDGQPIYRVIMTEAERARFEGLTRQSDAQMNATFVSLDGTGTEIRYSSGIRFRGNGSRGRPVANHRINIPTDVPWEGVDAINLNSQYPHSQVVGMTMFELAGLTAEEATAVQLRLNGQNLAVQPNVQNGSYARLEVTNSDFTDNHFLNDRSGNVYRGVNGGLDYLGENGNSYNGRYSKQTNGSENDWSDLIALTRALDRNQTPDSIFVATIQQVADVDQWMRFLAVNALLVNEENGVINGRGDDYSIYCGVVDPRCTLLPHDLDTVFAIGDGSAQEATIDRDIFEPRQQAAFDRLLSVPAFLDLYYFHLRDLAQTVFSSANVSRTIDRLLGDWVDPQTVAAAKKFAGDRASYVLSQIPLNPSPAPIAEITGEPAKVTRQTTATLVVGGEGVANYRFRVDGGALSASRSVSVPITLTGLSNGSHHVTVIGQNNQGLWQTEAQATVSDSWTVNTGLSPLVISEVLAVNESINHEGTMPDIIELQNRGATSINLAGMTITDDANVPNKFTFVAGTTIGAGQRLVLYANDPDGTSGIHLGFGLSRTGETISLFASNGGLLDSVKFGVQLLNRSISRMADDHWALTTPTIGNANGAALPLGNPVNLEINEWFTDGKRINKNDFIELYNPQPLPVALGGLYITDTIDGGRDRDKLTALSFIDSNGFQVFFADDDEGAGADHLNFNLDSIHEPIAIYDSELDLIDMVISGPQTTDISQGLSPDGSENYAYFGLPTPGFSNVNNPSAVALINGLRITEIMYNPIGTSDGEFIELQNVSGLPLIVTDVRIRGGVSFTFPSLVLNPGEVVVLVNNTAAFEAIYGTNVNVVGEFAGNLSNGGEEIELKVPLPLEVDILRFTYNDNPDLGWPTTPDGMGPSLVVIDTEGDYNQASNWRPSIVNGGTPGIISATLPGDFDFDGDLDLVDIEALHTVIVAKTNDAAYDVTDDGQVNLADLIKWVEDLKGTLMADANLDGFVDVSDFNRWNDHKFMPGGWASGDFDANGSVDVSDFNRWSSNRFKAASPAPGAARAPRAALSEQAAVFPIEKANSGLAPGANVTDESTNHDDQGQTNAKLEFDAERPASELATHALGPNRARSVASRRQDRALPRATQSELHQGLTELIDRVFADVSEL